MQFRFIFLQFFIVGVRSFVENPEQAVPVVHFHTDGASVFSAGAKPEKLIVS